MAVAAKVSSFWRRRRSRSSRVRSRICSLLSSALLFPDRETFLVLTKSPLKSRWKPLMALVCPDRLADQKKKKRGSDRPNHTILYDTLVHKNSIMGIYTF
jgi:hypothetical protein